MSTTNADSALGAELQRLEQILEVPIVPGEMAGWLRVAAEALEKVSTQLQSRVSEGHADVYKGILANDLNLATRVKSLQEQDAALVEQAVVLTKQFAALTRGCEMKEPDELALQDSVDRLSKEALNFVIDVRKQEAAVTTWFMEAFDRDRGTGD